MDKDWQPSDREIKIVLEAHGMLPEGPLLEEALGLGALYAERIRQFLDKFQPGERQKALLAVVEEGLMQEGIIPNNHERKFGMPSEEKSPR